MHVYLHVPFCSRKCHYCDFYSLPTKAGDDRIAPYLDALKKEIATANLVEAAETIYIGGGNPAILEPAQLERLLGIINTHIKQANRAEFSVELNPESVTREKLELLRQKGINRLSFGLQSIHDDELTFLGRQHSFSGFGYIYEAARELGFGNINVDIIHGFPGNTLDRLKETLEAVIALAPEHLSVYEYNRPSGSTWHPDFTIDEDLALAMWERKISMLDKAGYQHYEISNFCRPGHECRHNSGIWQGDDYLGFGPAAHSRVGKLRWANSPDVGQYLADQGISRSETRTLGKDDLIFECVLLGLRTSAGINRIGFNHRFSCEPETCLGTVLNKYPGSFEITDNSIRLTRKAILLYDELLKEIFVAMPAVSS